MSAVFLAALLAFSSSMRADDRPWLSYLINPSFWFAGPVDQTLSDSYYYSYNKQQIRFSPMGNWFELGNTLIEHADVATFEVLSRDFAKDKNHIYYQATPITEFVDYQSFSLINEMLTRDKNHVYVPKRFVSESVLDTNSKSPLHIITDANPRSFTVINDAWSQDENHHFYYFIKQDIDFSSFEQLSEDIVKDQFWVFIKKGDHFIKTNVEGANVSVLNEQFIYNHSHIFWYNAQYSKTNTGGSNTKVWLQALPYQDITSFKQFNEAFFALDNRVFYDKNPVEAAKVNTFQIINNLGFAKDANHVFYQHKMLDKADPHSFSLLLEHGHYGRDNLHIYFQDKLLGEKQAPLKILSNDEYLISGEKVFYQGREVVGAKAAKFELLTRFASYASDGEFIYFKDQKLDGVDLNSVVVINRDLAIRDANSVFWGSKRVEGADSATFTRSHRNYDKYDAEDKRFYYKNGIKVALKAE
ncbi:DKNYY domain-containing protein [Pseudoalteromonas sp. G4]|uniref:DKNYY domain-containing protein n=1 Tax=Pseudoalteromonas sp. G4 TaxID=2992761 RepID=UPI00237D9D53|nr:DKNYY domain-containing protein [Pseudoalteromonas sp. G4]MDE3272844.1 DKNYY domain-containing protein [Pseudoalteromonas sp. G4]